MSLEPNKAIRAKHAALTILSGRTLPTLASDLKVAALLKGYFTVPFQVTEAAREKLVKDIPDGWASDQLPRDLAIRWQAEVMDATQDLPDVPTRLKLTEKDMPLALKSNDGNRQGVADLIVALGDLFLDSPVDNPVDND